MPEVIVQGIRIFDSIILSFLNFASNTLPQFLDDIKDINEPPEVINAKKCARQFSPNKLPSNWSFKISDLYGWTYPSLTNFGTSDTSTIPPGTRYLEGMTLQGAHSVTLYLPSIERAVIDQQADAQPDFTREFISTYAHEMAHANEPPNMNNKNSESNANAQGKAAVDAYINSSGNCSN